MCNVFLFIALILCFSVSPVFMSSLVLIWHVLLFHLCLLLTYYTFKFFSSILRVSNIHYKPSLPKPWPAGCIQPRTVLNEDQPKCVNFLKTSWDIFIIVFSSSAIIGASVFFCVVKTIILLPMWAREIKKLDTSVLK